MQNFDFVANSARVVFGSETLSRLPDEIERLNVHSPLLLCTPRQTSQVEKLKSILGKRYAGTFSEARMHTPVHVTEKALAYAKECGADSVRRGASPLHIPCSELK